MSAQKEDSLLLKEQSDLCLHCLSFELHLSDAGLRYKINRSVFRQLWSF